MSGIVEQAILETTERRDDAKVALQDLKAEVDAGTWTVGELLAWGTDLRLAEDKVDLHERRLKMLRRQR